MSRRNDVIKYVNMARKQGWIVTINKGHWKFVPPMGRIVFTGSSPSDHRSVKNLERDLRHNGLILAT